MNKTKPKLIGRLNPQVNVDKEINQMIQEFDKLYLKSMRELEAYAYYIIRCLHRAGITVYPRDIGFATFERKNGTIAQAVFYPVTAAKDGEGVVNPAFFYGFKFDYDFRNLDHPFKVIFTEDMEELLK